MQTSDTRLVFLDWVRIIAFFVLIVYHVGMYYVTWDWHVKSPHASDAIEPLMLLTSPWRLGLLFMVSGVASSFMLLKTGAGRFVRERSVRLLVPLLFGMLVIVPLQPYFEVVEKVAYQGSFIDFMQLYLGAYQGFCKDGCLILPTWNHLWFVAYLWIYTLLLAALVLVLDTRFDSVAKRVASWLAGWKLIVLPVIVLTLARVLLQKKFPTTHALVDDWCNHAVSFFMFMLGAFAARDRAFWQRVSDLRWAGLGISVLCWSALTVYFSLPDAVKQSPQMAFASWLLPVVYPLFMWTPLVAAFGFAQRYLLNDGPARRYLTQAVFTVYIVHQTLIVSIAHLIKPADLAPPLEAALLIAATLCISFGIFEVVRRFALLRPLFGLHSDTGRASTPVQTKPAQAEELAGRVQWRT